MNEWRNGKSIRRPTASTVLPPRLRPLSEDACGGLTLQHFFCSDEKRMFVHHMRLCEKWRQFGSKKIAQLDHRRQRKCAVSFYSSYLISILFCNFCLFMSFFFGIQNIHRVRPNEYGRWMAEVINQYLKVNIFISTFFKSLVR